MSETLIIYVNPRTEEDELPEEVVSLLVNRVRECLIHYYPKDGYRVDWEVEEEG